MPVGVHRSVRSFAVYDATCTKQALVAYANSTSRTRRKNNTWFDSDGYAPTFRRDAGTNTRIIYRQKWNVTLAGARSYIGIRRRNETQPTTVSNDLYWKTYVHTFRALSLDWVVSDVKAVTVDASVVIKLRRVPVDVYNTCCVASYRGHRRSGGLHRLTFWVSQTVNGWFGYGRRRVHRARAIRPYCCYRGGRYYLFVRVKSVVERSDNRL